MDKVKKIWCEICGCIIFVFTLIGMFKVFSFDYLGFLAFIITLSMFLFIGSIVEENKKKDIKKAIEKSKEIYSLNYSNLVNIEGIELQENFTYRVKFKNVGLSIPIKEYLPKNQQELENLDQNYEQLLGVRIQKR